MYTKKEIVLYVYERARRRYGINRPIGKATTFEELKFDKYDIMYMIMSSEEIFNISISATEAATISNFKQLVDMIVNKMKVLGTIDITKRKAVPPAEETEDEQSTHEMCQEAAEKLGLTDEQAEHLEEKVTELETKLADKE